MQQLIHLHNNLICHLKKTKDSLSGITCRIACSDNEAEYMSAGFRVRGGKMQLGWKLYRRIRISNLWCFLFKQVHVTLTHSVILAFYVYNYVCVQLLKCGCRFFSWDKNSIQCSHKNKKIILQRIRERGHARGGKNLDPSDETQSANPCIYTVHFVNWI